MKFNSRSYKAPVLLLCAFCIVASAALAQTNEVLGEVELVGATKVEKTSGVWVDGQYLGYLDEFVVLPLGVLLVPIDMSLQPGQKQTVRVVMEKDNRVSLPTVTAEIKVAVNPDRAAVFVDGVFIGHVAEFHGMGKALLVAPGKRKIKVSLPGYQSFETEVNLVANQKFEIKTDLIKSGSIEADSSPEQK